MKPSMASRRPAVSPLAKALVEGGRVSVEDMEAVLEEHDRTGSEHRPDPDRPKLVTEADLMWGMAQEMGLEFVDLDTVGRRPDRSVAIIPEATARHHNVMVIANEDGTPVVAASNPTDVFAMDDLRTIIGRRLHRRRRHPYPDQRLHRRAFDSGGDAADMAMEASPGSTDVGDGRSRRHPGRHRRGTDRPLRQPPHPPGAQRAGLGHPHRADGEDLRIRYRIDGVLHDVSTAPRSIAAAVTTRLKVMADMNIAEHRIPQDGRISLNVGNKGIDLRMATLPTIHGEKIVMRVLDKSSVVLGFADLGLRRRAARRPTRTSTPSRTGPSWSPVRPDRASRPPSTRPSPRSTRRRRTSSPSRTRSSCRSRASTRSSSTSRPV